MRKLVASCPISSPVKDEALPARIARAFTHRHSVFRA